MLFFFNPKVEFAGLLSTHNASGARNLLCVSVPDSVDRLSLMMATSGGAARTLRVKANSPSLSLDSFRSLPVCCRTFSVTY